MKETHGKLNWPGQRAILPVSLLAILMLAVSVGNSIGAEAANRESLYPLPELRLDRFEPGVREAFEDAFVRVRQRHSAPDGKLADSYGELGMLFQAHDLADLAEPCYLNAQLLAPGQYQWPYLLGYIYQLDNRLNEAATKYRQALQLKPDFLPAMLHLGQTLNASRQDREAQQIFNTALESNPENAVALAGLGSIAFRRGEHEKAIGFLNKALAVDPQATRLNYMLAMAYRKLGDIDKARAYMGKRGNRNPAISDPVLASVQARLKSSQDFIQKGLDAYNAGKFGEAARYYRQAVDSAPTDLATRLALAWVLELNGNDQDALAEVELVLEADPRSAKAHYLKGALLAKSDTNRAALTHLRQAVTLEPDAETPRLVLATTLMRSGNYQEAETHYAKLADQQDNDAILLYRLGMARLASGMCGQAQVPLENALRIRANSLTVIQALLRAYSICPDDSKNHRETALVQAQRILDQIQRWESAETLAMALAANARYGDAAQLQQRVIDEARKGGESALTLEGLDRNLKRYLMKQPADQAWPGGAEVFRPLALTAQDRLQLDG